MLCLVHLHIILIILTLRAEVVLDHVTASIIKPLSIIIAPFCTVTWSCGGVTRGWVRVGLPGHDKQQSPVSLWLHGA